MLRVVLYGVLASVLIGCSAVHSATPRTTPNPSVAVPAGAPLLETLNRYRLAQGLQPVPLSETLTRVAATHVADLEANLQRGGQCNVNAWTSGRNRSSCCYINDHARTSCRWDEPKTLPGDTYAMPGYGIVAWYSTAATPDQAIEQWNDSAAHRAMLLNQTQWAGTDWHAVGVAMSEHYAVVWFSAPLNQNALAVATPGL